MARILILGSVASDEVVRLDRPLAEGAHLEGRRLGSRLGGGAANTGLALAFAGNDTVLISSIGGDALGRGLLAQLNAGGIDTSHVLTLHSPTTRSIVLIDDRGERTIVNLERCADPDPGRLADIPGDVLYVRSRAPGLAPVLNAKAARCRIVAHIPPLDAGGLPAHILVGSASDLPGEVLSDSFANGREIAGDILEWVVVTKGADGAEAYGANETISLAAPVTQAVDSTGAGDAFAAGLVHGLAAGMAMGEALKTACAFGAEAVRRESSFLPKEAVEKLL